MKGERQQETKSVCDIQKRKLDALLKYSKQSLKEKALFSQMLMDALCPISPTKQIAASASSSAVSREPEPTCVGEMCAKPDVFVHAETSTYRKNL